ncbi:MAG: glycosyl transferase family 2, partial [Candidatus Moranbacteria bacterium CG_4_10_14_3_um_filter_45_9]
SGPYRYYDLSAVTNWSILFWYRLGQMISFINTLITRRSGTMLQGGNFIIRRSALEKAGGFDLNFD